MAEANESFLHSAVKMLLGFHTEMAQSDWLAYFKNNPSHFWRQFLEAEISCRVVIRWPGQKSFC